MLNKFKTLSLLAIFMMLTGVTASQGWVIADADGSRTLISDGWIKTIDPEGESYSSVFNVKTKQLIIINDDEQVYAQGTIGEYCEAIRTLEDQLKENMSAEQRALMEEFMAEQEEEEVPDVRIEKMGTDKVAGYDTDRYRVFVNGQIYEEVWLTADGVLEELVELGNEMDRLISDMVDCSIYSEPGNDPESSEVYMKIMSQGIDLRSVDFVYGEEDTVTEVVSIERENISKSEFLPPADYKKVSLSDIMMMQ